MARTALLSLVALALAAVAFLLLRDGPRGGDLGAGASRDPVERGEAETLDAPQLQGHAGSGRPRPAPPTDVAPVAPPAQPTGEVLLRVSVVDAGTGQVLPGAHVWFEPSREPCPRLPGEEYLLPPPDELSSRAVVRHAADTEGRFELSTDRFARPSSGALDVFAQAPGYVLGVACGVRLPGATTIRLATGLALKGRVLDLRGAPLADAVVLARPGPNTTPVPGHAGWAVTDTEGRFAMGGLLPGLLTLRVEHVGHFPLTATGEDPSDGQERTFRLAPAFVLRFRLRTDDGREVVNPTVHVTAAGRPPLELLELLSLTGDTDADGRLTGGVALPATSPMVNIEIKADGYAPWSRPSEPVPEEGGERVLRVTLARDVLQGSLRLAFEDEAGRPVNYAEQNPLPPTLMPLDRQILGGGVVLEPGEALRFPALPVGRYRVEVRAFAYAPGLVEALVSGGAENEVRVTLRPTARLRVRFTAASARIVRFRLLQGAAVVPALPETPLLQPTRLGEEPALAAGEGGVLLGGLAAGSYVVEVLSDDLQSSRTSVSVREGETEEVEIRVVPR